jgi:hypothetical protein
MDGFYEVNIPTIITTKKKEPLPFKWKISDGRFMIKPDPSCNLDSQKTWLIKSINKIPYYKSNTDAIRILLDSKKKLHVEIEDALPVPIKNDALKINAVKLWLSHGLKFLRHSEKSGSSYISILKMVRCI